MATPAKRWPKSANDHRLRSIELTLNLDEQLTEAARSLRRNPDLALRHINQARESGRLIRTILDTAPAGDGDLEQAVILARAKLCDCSLTAEQWEAVGRIVQLFRAGEAGRE